MPNRPDLPCADCGELMWRGTTSLPEGAATCRPCRKERLKSTPIAPIETWDCQWCGEVSSRPKTRGQRPKWCAACSLAGVRQYTSGQCAECGSQFHGSGKKFCSIKCAALATVKNNHLDLPGCANCGSPCPSRGRKYCTSECMVAAQRSPIREAFESGDWPALVDTLKERTQTTGAHGCWEWSGGRVRDGYGIIRINGKGHMAHRLMALASIGDPGHLPVHHKCANKLCINPQHLQIVQTHENTAEMLDRKNYERRITELEAALRDLDAQHPLLQAPGGIPQVA